MVLDTCTVLEESRLYDVLAHRWSAANGHILTAADQPQPVSMSATSHMQPSNALEQTLSGGRESRRGVGRIPADVLRLIFLAAHAATPDGAHPRFQFSQNRDLARVALSFNLAAVCRQWRDIAVLTASLWSVIAIPHPARAQSASLADLVDTLHDRSRHWPLSVFLHWDTIDWDERAVAPVLAALAHQAARWQLFHLQLRSGVFPHSVYAVLRHSTPLLEDFCLLRAECDELEWDAHRPDVLTVCPKLRRFRSENTSVIFAIPPSSLTNLIYLELDVNLTCATVWDHLRCCRFLEILDIVFAAVPEDADDEQQNDLCLPRLRTLSPCACTAQMFAVNSTKVSFPALETIAVTPGTLLWMPPIFELVQQTLRHLDLLAFNTLTEQHAQCLRPLACLQHLSLGHRSDMRPEFLQALSVPHPTGGWIVPTLESLTVRSLTEASAGDFVALVASRNAAHMQEGVPKRIRDVRFEYENEVPRWVVTQIRELMDVPQGDEVCA